MSVIDNQIAIELQSIDFYIDFNFHNKLKEEIRDNIGIIILHYFRFNEKMINKIGYIVHNTDYNVDKNSYNTIYIEISKEISLTEHKTIGFVSILFTKTGKLEINFPKEFKLSKNDKKHFKKISEQLNEKYKDNLKIIGDELTRVHNLIKQIKEYNLSLNNKHFSDFTYKFEEYSSYYYYRSKKGTIKFSLLFLYKYVPIEYNIISDALIKHLETFIINHEFEDEYKNLSLKKTSFKIDPNYIFLHMYKEDYYIRNIMYAYRDSIIEHCSQLYIFKHDHSKKEYQKELNKLTLTLLPNLEKLSNEYDIFRNKLKSLVDLNKSKFGKESFIKLDPYASR